MHKVVDDCQMIPKIIHYCWFGKGEYSREIEMCISSWKKYCPDWEFKLWNEENSPMDVPWVKQTYRHHKFAFVADYVRFWALYSFGGVYLDTDMLLSKPLSPFLSNQVFLGREDAQTASMGIIGAIKGAEFCKMCMGIYEAKTFDLMDSPVPVTRIVSSFLYPYGFVEEDITQVLSNGVTVYQSDYFYPIHYTDRFELSTIKDFYTTNTVAVHLWNNSWKNEFQYLAAKEWKIGFGMARERILRTPFLPIKYYLRLIKYFYYWLRRR